MKNSASECTSDVCVVQRLVGSSLQSYLENVRTKFTKKQFVTSGTSQDEILGHTSEILIENFIFFSVSRMSGMMYRQSLSNLGVSFQKSLLLSKRVL